MCCLSPFVVTFEVIDPWAHDICVGCIFVSTIGHGLGNVIPPDMNYDKSSHSALNFHKLSSFRRGAGRRERIFR